ncbi:MAG TPA: efflux RND transporter periplasmic adaptor subunit [Anaerolineales bacterium]
MTMKRLAHGMMLIIFLFISGCSSSSSTTSTELTGSGTTSITIIQVAPEISGMITQINVAQGDAVQAGDVLFTLDDQLLQDQVDQANAAVQAAQANLDLAQSKQASAQAQYDLAVQAARQQSQSSYLSSWKSTPPENVTLPGWYFGKDEQVAALQTLVTSATNNLDDQQANLATVLADASNQDFVSVEKRLAQAEQAYTIAQATLNDAKAARDTTDLQDAAQKDLDSATSELDAARAAYNTMLSSDAASRVLKARANLAVARDRLNNTQLALDRFQTGDQSLQVTVARTALDQAKNGVSAAQASLSQAQAAQQMAQNQLARATVKTPISGTVLDLPINAGEVAAAGATVVEVGDLDQVILDLYIPENLYGRVKLGQQANISVDSFPGKTFNGTITYISDQAEFTPRTVQTVESRSTTVYKVEITLPNPEHDLKPGMPADATILTP